jgi:hypothetical protein
MKRAVVGADYRNAVGEAGERNAMKRDVGVAGCRHAVGEACREEG